MTILLMVVLNNNDCTPIEKDLARTISFFAFNNQGDFQEKYAQNVIEGFLTKQKLEDFMIIRLAEYIKLAIITSYLWRASYLADELQGNKNHNQLDLLNPAIHILQLKSFEKWSAENDFADLCK